ncbi:right-handed parallel beta-helix repeat-containing protein [Psychrobacillus sp. NEAU-3TGS]|uniref:right-handed parallel beta-helix repeat-containing protein n=1 Tax=Psychrobacillus sp. NEAU-3TGS TaxID=2995412 RepID=UPI0024976808|nr:right-handed parallel beta-helix repeat-containing protein [Psychrobacillus sp. NEAU-3TGS]MDI2588620.1 right-handed parallel beta-helix repeat-containing protein [Psychrobacillus sp. NEAU-3TGS]
MKKICFILLAATAIMIIFILNNIYNKQDQAIYVAINGNDQNAGTKAKPFRTLKKAASEANAGTTVLIRKGTYNEKLVIKHSGTKSKPITFKAYNKEMVVLSGKGLNEAEGDTSLVTINNKNYVTISGLIIQDLSTDLADETVMGIYITGSSNHITLENNNVRRIETHAVEGNGHGIAIYGTGTMKDINILNNTLEDLKLGSSESLALNGNIDGFKVENNIVRRNDNIGIDLIGYEGTSNDKKVDYVRNGIVKNNQVYEISSYANPAYGEDYSAGGIYIDGGKNITIEKNTIYKSDIGIEATSEHANKYADNIKIINNIIYDNYYTGISIGGYDGDRGGTINSTIAQNILYRNDTKGLDGGQLLLQHDTKNNVIEGNILTAGPSRIFISNYFSTNQENKLQKNVFHKERGEMGIWIWKEEEYTSFNNFKKASKSDEKSSYLDPKYQNANKYDFRLKKDSLAKKIVD